MIIYGTNLGTIVIRVILAAGLRGSAQRLVRFEDFFCLVSGVLMVALFYLEKWFHVPLVDALAEAVSAELSLQLAVVFLLSNLLPAVLLWPLLGPVDNALSRLWPPGKEEEDAVPKFLQPQALTDPPTALDLVYARKRDCSAMRVAISDACGTQRNRNAWGRMNFAGPFPACGVYFRV